MIGESTNYVPKPQTMLRGFPKSHPIYNHPFLDAARNKTLTLEAIKNFALQELFISLAFPSMMAEVVARIPFHREDLRLPIVQNMYEEMGNGNLLYSHPQLLRRLALQLGATEDQFTDNHPTKGVRSLVS